MAGKAALITGADSGIGRAVAIAFAREGADVLVSYLDERADAKETASWVTEAGKRAVLVPGDVSQEAHCKALVARTVEESGKIDILVNNAAFQSSHESIEETSVEEWDHTFRTNISAYFYLAKTAVGYMKPGGSIIATSSVSPKTPSPQSLARELCRARSRMDAFDPFDDAGGEVKEFGKAVPLERPVSLWSWRLPTSRSRRMNRATSREPTSQSREEGRRFDQASRVTRP